jgi:DNA-binding IclR family transcriptional regulator
MPRKPPDGLTVAEISRATVGRLLITLELLDYLEVQARKYRLQHGVPGEGLKT